MSAEPIKTTSQAARLLVVAAADDSDVIQFSEACKTAGWQVDFVTDVYLAMSRLADGVDGYSRVVVDARCLDAAERRFLELAPRYLPNVRIDELAAFVHRGVDAELTKKPEFAEAEVSHVEPIAVDAMPLPALHELAAEEVIPGRWEPVFSGTSGGDNGHDAAGEITPAVEEAEDETVTHLSLHDAVRRRMWAGADAEGNAPKPRQRIPPGTHREAVQPSVTPAADSQGRAALTRAELDALLGDEPSGGKGGAA